MGEKTRKSDTEKEVMGREKGGRTGMTRRGSL